VKYTPPKFIGQIVKMGPIFWYETPRGTLAPKPLHNMSDNDLDILQQVYMALKGFRRIGPAIDIIMNSNWDNRKRAIGFLRDSIKHRTGAREMIQADQWDEFWNSLN
jgi:hypothetical protein